MVGQVVEVMDFALIFAFRDLKGCVFVLGQLQSCGFGNCNASSISVSLVS